MGTNKEAPLSPKLSEPAPPTYAPDHPIDEGPDSIEPLPPNYNPNSNPDSDPSPLYTDSGSYVPLTQEELAQAIRSHVNYNDIDCSLESRLIEEASTAAHLFRAIDEGNQEYIARLISDGAVTANTKFRNETPLLRAVKKKNVQIVQQLLEAGADVNEFGWVVSTPSFSLSLTDILEM